MLGKFQPFILRSPAKIIMVHHVCILLYCICLGEPSFHFHQFRSAGVEFKVNHSQWGAYNMFSFRFISMYECDYTFQCSFIFSGTHFLKLFLSHAHRVIGDSCVYSFDLSYPFLGSFVFECRCWLICLWNLEEVLAYSWYGAVDK